MSHLTKIKTTIQNSYILQNTLEDLNIEWESNNIKDVIYINKSDNLTKSAQFKWNIDHYEFIADLEIWQNKIEYNSILEKIHQQYAYNCIINKAAREGFQTTNHIINQDGSIKILLEKWYQ